jgi:hypothetical protein
LRKSRERGLLCGPAGSPHSPHLVPPKHAPCTARPDFSLLGTARTAVRSVFPFCSSSSASVVGAGAKRGSLPLSVPTGPRLVSSVAGKEALSIFFLGLTACFFELRSVQFGEIISFHACVPSNPNLPFLGRMRERSSNPIPFGVHGFACLLDAVVPSIFVNLFWDCWWKHQRLPLVMARNLVV